MKYLGCKKGNIVSLLEVEEGQAPEDIDVLDCDYYIPLTWETLLVLSDWLPKQLEDYNASRN